MDYFRNKKKTATKKFKPLLLHTEFSLFDGESVCGEGEGKGLLVVYLMVTDKKNDGNPSFDMYGKDFFHLNRLLRNKITQKSVWYIA